MLIDFNNFDEMSISSLNGGDGTVLAKIFMDKSNKIMISRIPPKASIGQHKHETSSEIDFVFSGIGKAICDGKTEELKNGICHYCPKLSSHSIINTGESDLILFTVVPEQ